MKKKWLNILLFLIGVLWAVTFHAADNEILLRELKQHGARSAATWSGFKGKDIKERILPAPDIVIDYLRKDNAYQGYKERPEKAGIDQGFFSDILRAILETPQSVRNQIHEHVIAVFLVQELAGSAYVELLRDFDDNRMGFIVLDVGSLNRKANEWASWKENSPFAAKGMYRIEARIEKKTNDSRMAAIQYIFLHELGHLVGVAKGAHPSWFVGGNPQKWPFAKLSWLTCEDAFKGKSKFDESFTSRSKIRFYLFEKAPLSSKEIYETYNQWIKTNFVSLYAATNMYDDFAETYAMFVHVALQKRPWAIRIMKGDRMVREITNTILSKRCMSKKIYLDKVFK